MKPNLPIYRWPDLSTIQRAYVVRDERGRYGIGIVDTRDTDVIWVRPVGLPKVVSAGDIPGTEALPEGAAVLTSTAFRWDGMAYRGVWSDYPHVGRIPEDDIRTLTILDDIGWIMPDWVADEALAGSDQVGYWDYGAKLGKVGGEPPIKGMAADEITISQASDFCREVGQPVSERGLRLAARRGYIPGARKIGRDWVIPWDGINYYLDNSPKPGPRPAAPTRSASQDQGDLSRRR